MMKKIVLIFMLAGALVLTAFGAWAGDAFPDFTVEGNLTAEQAEYLGSETSKATLSSIPAPYLLIEVFSMYCPICQREAEAVNGLFERLRPHADTLRMIGIGTGNTPYEVQFFKEQFQVPFPMFHDEDFAVNKALGEVGTPHFVLVKNDGEGRLESLLVHEGSLEDMSAFEAEIRKLSGL